MMDGDSWDIDSTDARDNWKREEIEEGFYTTDEELNNMKGEWAKKEQDMKQKLEVLNYEKQRSLQKQEALQREHNVLLLKLEVMEDEQENLQNNQIALLEEIEEKRKTHEERRRMLLQNLNNSFNILTNFVMSEERVMF